MNSLFFQLFVLNCPVLSRNLEKTRASYFLSVSKSTKLDALTLERIPNLSKQVFKYFNSFTDTPTPEAVFHYVYAILHSHKYRSRYAEFLRIDFPRIPFTFNESLFCQIAEYGEALVALHLMDSPKLRKPITEFEGNANRVVDSSHPKYADGKVIINKKGDGFTGVPEEVWKLNIGGYQVCHKWLKDRKGRTLTPEDITHYQRIVVALQETTRLMQQIDETIPGFPIK